MPFDPDLVATFEAALRDNPDSLEMRLHVADLLLDGGRVEVGRALEHCVTLLSTVPDHCGAVQRAERAARLLGDDEAAEAYARLRHALARASDASVT